MPRFSSRRSRAALVGAGISLMLAPAALAGTTPTTPAQTVWDAQTASAHTSTWEYTDTGHGVGLRKQTPSFWSMSSGIHADGYVLQENYLLRKNGTPYMHDGKPLVDRAQLSGHGREILYDGRVHMKSAPGKKAPWVCFDKESAPGHYSSVQAWNSAGSVIDMDGGPKSRYTFTYDRVANAYDWTAFRAQGAVSIRKGLVTQSDAITYVPGNSRWWGTASFRYPKHVKASAVKPQLPMCATK
jgi:hypothetical protein